MTERRFIDTNLIMRYLLQDHAAHAEAASRLFEACDAGKIRLLLLSEVVAECVFVLESFYRQPREGIADALSRLIESPGIEICANEAHADALRRYSEGGMHFVDCVLAAAAAKSGFAVATFDKGFKRYTDVKVKLSV